MVHYSHWMTISRTSQRGNLDRNWLKLIFNLKHIAIFDKNERKRSEEYFDRSLGIIKFNNDNDKIHQEMMSNKLKI